MLFLYAVPFSYAYTQLSAGTGALILFGAVQVTMLVSAAKSGETLRLVQWLGVLIALAAWCTWCFPAWRHHRRRLPR